MSSDYRRLGVIAAIAFVSFPAQGFAAVLLAPHRAVYELTLSDSRGSTQINDVRGKIVYEFKGNACDGYDLQFRQVTEISGDQGGANVSDLRSATWEDGKGKSFRFNAQNFLNQQLDRSTDGKAERGSDAVKVTVEKPNKVSNSYDAQTIFPTEHLVKIIEAAARGEPILQARVYDGSEAGDKSYETLTVIGKGVDKPAPDLEPQAKNTPLETLEHWPVAVSYFERDKKTDGEQTPDYEMSFDLYSNGVSRALKIDYGEFTLEGKLTELEFLKPSDKPCK